jgi:hypothetical protein
LKEDLQLIKYKKYGFFEKIKNKIKGIFSKKEEVKVVTNNINLDKDVIDKKRFFETYEKVKNQEIKIEDLDKETIKKILLMTVEELNINSKKIDEKLKVLKISLDNTKIYSKEIEMMKNNLLN